MPPGGALAFTLWPWIRGRTFRADLALRFDALSAVMVLVVTGVGALIHVYSIGYMAHDEDYARFFTYMNLFVLSMLDAGAGRQPPADVRGLGGRGAVLLSADRVLVQQPGIRLQRAQGVHRQPHRRRRFRAGHSDDRRRRSARMASGR